MHFVIIHALRLEFNVLLKYLIRILPCFIPACADKRLELKTCKDS